MHTTVLKQFQNNFYGFIMFFFKEQFPVFEDFQLRWIKAVSEHKDSDNQALRIAVQSCKGAGKTTMQALTLIWFCMCFPEPKIRGISSTKYQTEQVLLNECRKLLERAKLIHLFSIISFAVRLKDDNSKPSQSNKIAGLVANEDRADRAAGDHSEYNLYIVDEASTLGRNIYNSINGIFATGKSYFILSGNPTDLTGTSIFYEICTSNIVIRRNEERLTMFELDKQRRLNEQWLVFQVGVDDLKRANYNRKTMEEVYKKGTKEHDMYVLGKFPLFTQSNFISREVIKGCFDISRRKFSTDLNMLNSNVVIGIDVAFGEGNDYTCAIARCNGQAKMLYYDNTDRDKELIGRKILDWKSSGARVVMDCNNVGRQILIWVSDRGQHIVDVSLSKAPTNNILFTNHKSELLWRMKEWFENKDPYLECPSGDIEERIIREGVYMDFKPVDGKYDIGNKKRMSFSPDICDALSYTFFYGTMTKEVDSDRSFDYNGYETF